MISQLNYLSENSPLGVGASHGGEIKVETKQGEGTEFIIQLPV